VIASPSIPVSRCQPPLKLVHALTLTPFYPSSGDEPRGCFIAEPLEWTELLGVKNTVCAVQPFYRGRAQATDCAPAADWIRFVSLPSNFGLPSAGAFLFTKLLRKVRDLHRLSPIDIVHAHGALPCGHAAALLSRELGIPFVVTVHGLDVFSTHQVSGLAGRWAERVSRFVYQSATRVICVSEKVRERVAGDGSRPSNTTVIHNGVDAELFCPLERAASSHTILSTGDLIPSKAHALLLRAFAGVRPRFPEIELHLIGEGQELANLRQLAAKLNIAHCVHFLGRQSRRVVAQEMQRCRLFALTSSSEALGCVYLEAMSAGKAVIGCRGQGIEDVVEHAVNGWLVQPGDLEETTAALSILLSDSQLRRQLGQAARATIVKNFTLGHQADQLNRVYREAAA
jgi:teichuronic acid biosynthesis glycosyltransferase TuaC